MIQALDSILIFCRSVDNSVAWYQDVLGLGLRHRHGDFAVLEAGELRISLHGGAPAEGYAGGGVTPVLRVADYEAAKAALEAKGCRFGFENQAGNARFGSFRDPDGNPLQILARD